LRLFVHPPVGAELVVLAALLRIAQDLVGLVDLLEASLGRFVAGVHIRMMLAGELPVRLLQFLVRRRLRHSECLVVILEFHRFALSQRRQWRERSGLTTERTEVTEEKSNCSPLSSLPLW